MAERNQNRGNQSWQSDQDWNQNKNRSNQNDWNQNREDYGYNQERRMQSSRRDYRDYDKYSNQDDYSRVNYMPDNDENRYSSNRDYENTPYGTSGSYGYRQNYNQNQGGLYTGMGNTGNYSGSNYGGMSGQGSQGNDYGQSSWQRENQYSGGSYGNYGSYGNQNYGNRNYGNRNYGNESYGNTGNRENMYRGNQGYNQNRNDRGWWDRTRDEVSSWFGDEDAERRRDMDKTYEGGHRGKGPKSYRRSEERIKEDVCDRLTDDDMLDASGIDIEVNGDEVTLTGVVNNRMQKRRAEDLVESVSGVRNVENRLRVGQSNITLTDSSSGTYGMLKDETKGSDFR